jgi:RNA polymerase sigma-70 factor (ECF subfamily)
MYIGPKPSAIVANRNSKLIEEVELVRLLRQREKRGYSLLYDNYSPALYGVIRKIVRSEELAQDVLQDAFVKIWRSFDSFDDSKGSLFTWILNVARNTAIDRIRSQSYKQAMNAQSLNGTSSVLEISSATHQSVDHIGLDTVLPLLRPEHREIIDYVYFKGFTQTEVAENLGMPLGTVKTRVRMAIDHLRKILK